MKTNRSYRLLGVAGVVALAACSSLLDVKNPNNVNQSDLSNPASAASQASGVLASVARAWGQILTPYSIATDELTWIGSRDAWQTLDQGTISEPTNEFVDAAFFYVGEARWWSDETIKRLRGFDSTGVLPNRDDLARTYLSASMIYTMIGNLFDNFPIGSDRTAAAPPLGPAAMDSVYKTAISYATSGIAIAQATGNQDLELALTSQRAVARYYLAVWAKMNPAPATVPLANPLVNDAGAVADANAALALAAALGTPDWRYQFHYDPTTISTDIGFEVNERLEMRIGSAYVYPICTVSGCATGGKTVDVDSLRLKDPVDNRADPHQHAVRTADVSVCSRAPFDRGRSGARRRRHHRIPERDQCGTYAGRLERVHRHGTDGARDAAIRATAQPVPARPSSDRRVSLRRKR